MAVYEKILSMIDSIKRRDALLTDMLTLRGKMQMGVENRTRPSADPSVQLKHVLSDMHQDLFALYPNEETPISTIGDTITPKDVPGNTVYANKAVSYYPTHGTATAYSLSAGQMYSDEAFDASAAKTWATSANGPLGTYSVEDGKAIYLSPTDQTTYPIPAFADIEETILGVLEHAHFYCILTNKNIYCSPDLFTCSKPIPRGAGTSIADLSTVDYSGRVIVIDDGSAHFAKIYPNMFIDATPIPYGLPNSINGLSPCIAGSFIRKDGACTFFDSTNKVVHLIVPGGSTDNSKVYEVPMCCAGSIYIDMTVIQITGLGFVPDKVFLRLQAPNVTCEYYDAILNSESTAKLIADKVVGRAYYKSTSLDKVSAAKCCTAKTDDIHTTLGSGFICQDGFILNLPKEFMGSVIEYICIGRSRGEDPYFT